jgi:hypothetical protein
MRTPEQRDADLEAQIDAALGRALRAPSEPDAAPHMAELASLLRQRSIHQQIKCEFERRELLRKQP